MSTYDSLVIGAGQAGQSSSFHLKRLGINHVLLDGEDFPGGAWQHRWNSLTMNDVHGVADLPDGTAPTGSDLRANTAVPEWFQKYENEHDLPVMRPARVTSVSDDDGALLVRVGDREWRSRTLVNATGTWRRPFIPRYPGQELFVGKQLHTQGYVGRQEFAGKRVIVVGAGPSAIQFIGELAPISDVTWVSRHEPRWTGEGDTLRDLVRRVQEHVVAGKPPHAAKGRNIAVLRGQEMEAAATGIYERWQPMFEHIEPDGVRWSDGSFAEVDVILWATGFRHDIDHLAPLHLRTSEGGIALIPGKGDVQTSVTSARDPRIQLVGYGASASTIGGNRAGRAAAVAVRDYLAATGSSA